MVPNLSPQNLAAVEIGKDFMLSHGYIKNNFDVQKWARLSSWNRPPEIFWKKNGRSKPLRSFPRRRSHWDLENGSANRLVEPFQ